MQVYLAASWPDTASLVGAASVGPKLGPCTEAQSPHLKLDGPPGVVHPKALKATHATNADIHLRGRLDMQITMVRSFLNDSKTAFAWPHDTDDARPKHELTRGRADRTKRFGRVRSSRQYCFGRAKSADCVDDNAPRQEQNGHPSVQSGATFTCLSQHRQRHLRSTRRRHTLPADHYDDAIFREPEEYR